MLTTSETNSVPYVAAPLSQHEQVQHQRQVAGLRNIHRQDRAQARGEWHRGHFYLQIRELGLWHRVPAHAGQDFFGFVAQVTGDHRSRSTIERRLALAQGYGLEAFLSYVERGVSPTVLAEIQRCDPRLRGLLLGRAEKGLSLFQLEAMRATGSRLLRGQDQAQLLSGEELGAEMDQAAAKAQLKRTKQRDRRANGPRPGPLAAPEMMPVMVAAESTAEQADLAQRKAELDQRYTQLKRCEADLERREAAIVITQTITAAAAPAAGAATATATGAGTGTGTGAGAGAGTGAGTGTGTAAGVATAAVEKGPPPGEGSPRSGREGQDAPEGPSKDAEDLEQLREELAQQQLMLDLQKEQLDTRQQKLSADEAQIAKDSYQAAQFFRQNFSFRWPVEPHCLDLTLLCMEDLLGRVATLATRAKEQNERRGQLPEEGGMALLFRINDALRSAKERVTPLVRDIAKEYRTAHPREAERFFDAYEAQKRKGAEAPREAAAAEPGTRRPAQRFHLPTAALLGTPQLDSPQQGLFGEVSAEAGAAALFTGGAHAVALFGQQGAGKSNTILCLSEMALGSLANICQTPEPMLVVHGHFAESEEAPPPWSRYLYPNDNEDAIRGLRRYGARPQPLPAKRAIVYVPPLDEGTMAQRRAELAGLTLKTLQFGPKDLDLRALLLLMGSSQKAPLYMMKIARAVEGLESPSFGDFCRAVEGLKLGGAVREIVQDRLGLIERLMGDGPSLCESVAPGDFVGLDLRAPWIDESRAMALFSVAMGALSRARGPEGQSFGKMIVLDEAHRYMGQGVVSADMLRLVREMRHRKTWLVYASQDPESVHPALIRLSSMVVAHRLQAQSSLKVLREQCAGFAAVTAEELARQERGEARIIVSDCADSAWRQRPQRLQIRPSCAASGPTSSMK